jgi:hypothetical protein
LLFLNFESGSGSRSGSFFCSFFLLEFFSNFVLVRSCVFGWLCNAHRRGRLWTVAGMGSTGSVGDNSGDVADHRRACGAAPWLRYWHKGWSGTSGLTGTAWCGGGVGGGACSSSGHLLGVSCRATVGQGLARAEECREGAEWSEGNLLVAGELRLSPSLGGSSW